MLRLLSLEPSRVKPSRAAGHAFLAFFGNPFLGRLRKRLASLLPNRVCFLPLLMQIRGLSLSTRAFQQPVAVCPAVT